MKEEAHEEAFEVHKRTIFRWALEIEGLEKSQRIIGLHASRGIMELFSLFLHRKKLVNEGFQLNHRWFKSNKVFDKIPEFEHKKEILDKMIRLENLCEILSYGKERSVKELEEIIVLFKELEETLKKII